MAPLLEDPRFRQTWNSISHNAENATENAAAGIWTFSHDYINPCLSSISTGVSSCVGQCFPDADERARRFREGQRRRGRAEYSFDFYDDWEEEEAGGGIMGWGDDELDQLLAGSGGSGRGSAARQPSKKKRMSYGTGRNSRVRKGTGDALSDPTIIPSTNKIGILGRLPFKLGGTLRYKPSAADLQDNPGQSRAERQDEENEALLTGESDEGDEPPRNHGHRRQRSSTTGSGETTDSMRSRGDLFPSDGEDDAVPLSDEFAMALERRNTGLTLDDRSSGWTKASKGKRNSSRPLSRTVSRTTQSSGVSGPVRPPFIPRSTSASSNISSFASPGFDQDEMPTLSDLQIEEERLYREEEEEVQRKRDAATELARRRGMSTSQEPETESKHSEGIALEIEASPAQSLDIADDNDTFSKEPERNDEAEEIQDQGFVPARLPHF